MTAQMRRAAGLMAMKSEGASGSNRRSPFATSHSPS
jgi:hypothetical protein